MDVIVERCAALDVHKKTVMAAVRTPGPRGRHQQVKEFATFTGELEKLRDWLSAEGVTQVAMEATGVYWRPVWHVLEAMPGVELLLVNPRHVKNLPGRKTDVGDAAWLAQLLECGLLRGSFVPPREIARLRDLTRYRTKLSQERAREAQRIQKLLEDAGIKLDSVATDVLGKACRRRASGGTSTTWCQVRPRPRRPAGRRQVSVVTTFPASMTLLGLPRQTCGVGATRRDGGRRAVTMGHK